MKIIRVVPFFVILFLSSNALGGAWDVGPFDNDDAADWVWELEESSDLSVVKAALKAVTESSSYIEAPTGTTAIAAAEVVAALKGQPHAQLPDEVATWVETQSQDGNGKLVELALQAIARVQDLDNSELAQLWSDSEELRDSWVFGLADLKRRLQ